jgi:hypothetical protein
MAEALIVAWQLFELMSQETGRPVANLLEEFEHRIARRDAQYLALGVVVTRCLGEPSIRRGL